MLILHACVLPTPMRLYLWAEATDQAPRTRKSTRRIAPHPFGASASSIMDAPHRALENFPDFGALAQPEMVALRLPSTPEAPLPSPDFARIQLSDAAEPAQLTAWRVEAKVFAPLAALSFFGALPYQVESPAFVLSDDARYWSLAAKFALVLLARQRFLPALECAGGQYRAQWIPSLDDARDQQRFTLLVKAMPPVERAASQDDLAPRALLRAFLSEVIDAVVRDGAQHPIRRTRASNVETKWLAALFRHSAPLSAKAGELASFRESLDTWQQQLRVLGDATYRVCFRLEPPLAVAPRLQRGRGERRDEKMLSQLEWAQVVLDEAQNIKKPVCKADAGGAQASRRAPHRAYGHAGRESPRRAVEHHGVPKPRLSRQPEEFSR